MAKTPSSAETLGEWQNMTRQYWDAWADATRKAFGGAADPATPEQMPWHEGLEQWSRMFNASKAQNTQSEVVEHLLGGARSYFSLLESMAAGQNAGGAMPDAHAWTDAVRESFNFPGADVSMLDNPLARAMREMVGKGARGFEQMMESIEPAMTETRAMLDMPAFGYFREHQEHYQRMAKAWLDYQQQNNRYNALIARASRRSFEVFEDKLAERGEHGPQVDSVRRLYDLWVEAAEDAYAEVALSAEFREVYGALVNAQMRVRKHLQRETERICTNLGIPTRTQIDSIGKRVHDLHREAKNRNESMPALAAEVAELRAEVAALKAERTGSAAKPARAAKKTSAPRRKPAKAAKKQTAAAGKSRRGSTRKTSSKE